MLIEDLYRFLQHLIGCIEHRFIRDWVDGLALDRLQDAFGFGFHWECGDEILVEFGVLLCPFNVVVFMPHALATVSNF